MKIIDLIQGTPEWHAHRAQHLNASDTPAMLGCSPYKTRAQLLRETSTGIGEEHDDATLQRFADGHRFEALARPLAEQIIGEDLFPVTGTEGKFSASFDGITLLEDTAFEHKTLNDDLRAAMVDGCTGADLPLQYQVQMEHQTMVSGATRVLFMASKWRGDELVEERHCWYTPDPDLRARLVAGWEQFEADVAAYEHVWKVEPAAICRAPDALPALSIQVTGMVTASNLCEFKASALEVLGGINRDLQTDDDFANAELTVKWCSGVEDRLAATKQQILGQTADIDAVFRTIDEVSAETRRVRLELEKLVKAEKENRRGQIVADGVRSVRDHYDSINATLGEHSIQPPQSLQLDIASAIKGKKSLASMQDAVSTAAANAKIAASQQADRVRANVAILAEHDDHATLFADRVQLCASKAPEDMRNLVAVRISEHQQREQERLDAEREKIRKEEADRLEREQQERDAAKRRLLEEAEAAERRAAEQAKAPDPVAAAAPVAQQSPAEAPPAIAAAQDPVAAPPAATGELMKLGDINAAIAPLSITAEGLAQLGFQPVATERASKLYDSARLPAMVNAMQHQIGLALTKVAA